MANDGTLRIRVLGDVTDWQNKASTMQSSLGRLGTITAGIAAGGFAAFARGAAEGERAVGNFQAATGKSRQEAEAFARGMNGLVGTANTVGRSFSDITAAGTKVAQQFDVSGDKLTSLTDKFLGFAKVTGQDAAGAVDDFDAVLDAFGEPAERAVGLMDQLIASNQKYGTDAGPAALSALQGFAPALQAMGEDLDAGIGLLNLFEAAGMDAGAAARGLNTAVQELEPGETLDDLIARLGAIEDPAERAQAAMEIFGTRSGVGLANAIQPGMRSLDEFIPTVEETAGTLDRASGDMVTTTDKIRGAFEKLLAGARDIGMQMGPALAGIGGLASLAAPLAGNFKSMLTSFVRLVLPSAVAAGTATGTAQGTAHAAAATGAEAKRKLSDGLTSTGSALAVRGGVGWLAGAAVGSAFGLGLIAVAAMVILEHKDEIADAFEPAGDLLDNILWPNASNANNLRAQLKGIADHLADEWDDEARVNLRQRMRDAFEAALELGWGEVNAFEYAKRIGEQAAAGGQAGYDLNPPVYGPPAPGPLAAEHAAVGEELGVAGGTAAGHGYSDSFAGWLGEEGGAEMTDALSAATHEAMLEAHRIAAWGGAATPGEYAQGLRSDFDSVRDGFRDLRELMRNELSPAEQEAELIGIATSRRLARGLEDERPVVRATSQQIALDTLRQLHAIAPGSEAIGTLSMLLLASATEDEKPAIRDAISEIVNAADTRLDDLPGIAEEAGEDTGAALARGLGNMRHRVTTAADALAGIIRGRLELGSPAKEGPWSQDGGPMEWAEDAMRKVGDSLERGLAHTRNRFRGAFGDMLDTMGQPPTLQLATAPAGRSEAPITVNAYGYQASDVERQILRARRRQRLMDDLTGGIGRADV